MARRIGIMLASTVVLMFLLLWFARDARNPTRETIDASAGEVEATPGRSEGSPSVAIERTMLPSPKSQPEPGPPGPAQVFRLVRADTKEPVAAVEVRWVRLPNKEEGDETPPRLALSDRRGEFEIPCVLDGERFFTAHIEGRVETHRGNLYAEETVWIPPFPDEAQIIPLCPDADVQVRVEDSQGEPVSGVLVVVRETKWNVGSQLEEVTDENGVALLRHLGHMLWRFHYRQDSRLASTSEWEIALGHCLNPPVARAVDLIHLPTHPVTLVLPATGSVVVQAVDPGGEMIPVTGTTFLGPMPEDDSEPGHLAGDPSARCTAEGTIVGGRAMFSHVGLEQFLQATVSLNDGFAGRTVQGEGPQTPGEVVTLSASVASGCTTYSGRAVTEEGVPIAFAHLLAERVQRPSPGGRLDYVNVAPGCSTYHALGTLVTDAKGRFVFDSSQLAETAGGMVLVVLSRDRGTEVAIEGSVELDPPGSGHSQDLGDVTLRAAPILATGRVTDDTGQPLDKVAIEGDRPIGSRFSRIRASTRTNGTFTLRGTFFEDSLSLTFRRLHYAEYRCRLETGTRDLEVVLPRGGSLRGHLLLPEDIDGEDLVIWAVMTEPPPQEGAFPRRRHAMVAWDGGFYIADAHPGVWRLEVKSKAGMVMRSVDGIILKPGEWTECPDIPLDKPTYARNLRIISAINGEPLDGMYLVRANGQGSVEEMFDAAVGGQECLHEYSGGKARVITEASAVDVVVVASGHRMIVVRGLDIDRVVELPPELRVHVHIERFRGLPPKPMELRVRLQPVLGAYPERLGRWEGETYIRAGESTAFNSKGEAWLGLPCPGEYRVTWMIYQPGDFGRVGRAVGEEESVSVLDTTEEQEMVLVLDEDVTKQDPEDLLK